MSMGFALIWRIVNKYCINHHAFTAFCIHKWLKRLILNTLSMILCKWGLWSLESEDHQRMGFLLWCFSRPLVHLSSFSISLFVFLQLALLSEIHSWSIWDQLINASMAAYFTSYLSKIPGLLWLYLLGHYQSVLWSTIQPTLLQPAESSWSWS